MRSVAIDVSDLGHGVISDTGELTTGLYAPVTRLISPAFKVYINSPKRSPTRCPEKYPLYAAFTARGDFLKDIKTSS